MSIPHIETHTKTKTSSPQKHRPQKGSPAHVANHPAAIIQDARTAPGSLTAADVLQLQRTIGNQAVGQLLAEIGRLPSKSQQVPVQRQGPEEEEELMQGKMIETVQRQEAEEEELMQGKFASGLTDTLQAKEEVAPNRTGMPDHLKSGIEKLSGMDLSGVRVHYSSSKPTQINALAYTQGKNIHVASGQEKHLPHEAWHVVQQSQGRVRPTMQYRGVAINDDVGLEREADLMGKRAGEIGQKVIAHELTHVVQQGSENGGAVRNDKKTIAHPTDGTAAKETGTQQTRAESMEYSTIAAMTVIQRDGGKIDPGKPLPEKEALVKARGMGDAAENEILQVAKDNADDAAFLEDVKNSYQPSVKTILLTGPAQKRQETDPDMTKEKLFDDIIWPSFVAALANAGWKAKYTVADMRADLSAPSLELADDLEPAYKACATTYMEIATTKARDKAGEALWERYGKLELEPVSKEDKPKFSAAIKKLPTVKTVLEEAGGKEAQKVVRGEAVSGWKAGGKLSDSITESNLNDDRKEEGKIIRSSMDTFPARVEKADNFIRILVEPALLSAIPRPEIFVHLKYGQGGLFTRSKNTFRAYQTGNEVHVAQDDSAATIAHEIGHYLEGKLPSETWLDIFKLIRQRHEDISAASRKKDVRLAGKGASGMKKEGRYRGEYPATGKYTSSAYGGGETEVMSMTIELLSDKTTAKDMIDKDPQQTAIILRGVIPTEYNGTGDLRPYDKYLPKKGD